MTDPFGEMIERLLSGLSYPPRSAGVGLGELVEEVGSRVDDHLGARVGRLAGVYADLVTHAPVWLLIRPGLLGEHFVLVPAEGVAVGRRRLMVPYKRALIRHAPFVSPEAHLGHGLERGLCRHYGLESRRAQIHCRHALPTARRAGVADALVPDRALVIARLSGVARLGRATPEGGPLT